MKKLNLLSISFSYEEGGAEKSLKNLVTELKKKGINIFLFTSPSLKDFYKEKNINIYLIPFSPSMNFFIKIGKIKLLNIHSFLRRFFVVINYSWQISIFCKKRKIDIIHINDFKGGIFIPLLKLLTHSKIVWHIRDLFAWESKIKKYYYKVLGSFTDLLITISPLTQKMVKDMGFNNAKLIYNIIEIKPLDISKKKARKILKIPEDKFVIAYIGRISKEKEIENLIEAIRIVKEKIKNLLCLIVGEDFKGGGEKERLFKIVEKKGLKDYVKFTGWQKNIEYYYSALDLFVHPREKTYEPLGRTFIEAMFYGTPILGTNILSWLIKDRENGFIGEEGYKGLASKIIELYEKKELLKTVSENAKKFAEENFKKENLLKEFQTTFEKLKRKNLKLTS